ncbi:MAG: FAD-binding oxidoreductase [Gaiellaceae bacterium]
MALEPSGVKARLEDDLAELRRSLSGTVVEPADSEYDAARRCFNALVDRRPAVIARCVGAEDIAVALDFAGTHELEVAVRGGGHNPAGHCVCDDGLVIDLSGMRGVAVDPVARIARAQGGATWLDFDTATQEFGLVTPGGIVGSTGVTGLALGGGIGHLTAQLGLTCDSIAGAELVIPDGTLVQARPDENSELLWGLHGGGGNFGVVTRLEVHLHPLERVVGGRLEYRDSAVGDVLRTFRDVTARSPRDLSIQAVLGLDETLAPALLIAPCYTGSESDPEPLRRLRAMPGLVRDTVGARPFLEQQLEFDSPYGENRHYWKGHFVDELTDELIDELLVRTAGFRKPGIDVLFESLHGAPKDVDPTVGGIRYRNAGFNVSVMGTWRDAADDESHIALVRETAEAIEPWSFGGGYANYMQADEPLERVRAAFGDDAFERLQALKRQYDPTNVLRRNQNIPPA